MGRTGVFLVVVHDVAPPFAGELARIAEALAPLAGGRVAGAVVPRWRGAEAAWSPEFRAHAAQYGELLLHGYTHQSCRAPGPVGLLTDGADELAGLSPEAAAGLLTRGQRALARLRGSAARGFAPPAWQMGPLTPRLLAACGLEYALGLTELLIPGAPSAALATWSWDCGELGSLGLAGEALGSLAHALRPAATPCVVLHPRDVPRGHLPRALDRVRRLLGAGLRPTLPGELAASLAGGAPRAA